MSGLEEVTLYEVIQAALERHEIDFHVSMPAKVQSYDASKQTVDVVPQLNRSVPDGAGNHVTDTLPALADVPVCFPRAGGFFVSFPIQAGDFVLLVFSDRNIGHWRSVGNQGDPGDLGLHTLDGAVAIPGVYPSSQALSSADGTNMVLGRDDDAGGRIVLTDSEVHLGGGADDRVVTKKDLQALYFAISEAEIIAEDGGASFKSTLLARLITAGWTTGTTDGQLGSSKIKALR